MTLTFTRSNGTIVTPTLVERKNALIDSNSQFPSRLFQDKTRWNFNAVSVELLLVVDRYH